MGFNWSDMSTATKLLLAAGLLLFIDLFLDWQQVCVNFAGAGTCAGVSGWHGAVGVILGLLVLALIVWEAINLLGLAEGWGLPLEARLISVALAAGILVFTILKVLTANEARHWPQWIGLLLAIAIAVGGWLKWSEAPTVATTTPATEPPTAPPPPAAPPA